MKCGSSFPTLVWPELYLLVEWQLLFGFEVVSSHTNSPSQSVPRYSELWQNPSSGMPFRLVIAGRRMLVCILVVRAFTWKHWLFIGNGPNISIVLWSWQDLLSGCFWPKKWGWRFWDHPVYWPDLMLCDFWHFQNWRPLSKARDFQTQSEFTDVLWPSWWAFQKGLEGFLEMFIQWKHQLTTCSAVQRDQFKGKRQCSKSRGISHFQDRTACQLT